LGLKLRAPAISDKPRDRAAGAGNQAHLQSLQALKAGITRDHHGIGWAQPAPPQKH
jgi:hypothetical protein